MLGKPSGIAQGPRNGGAYLEEMDPQDLFPRWLSETELCYRTIEDN